jgi:hypothetical protein
MLCTFQIPIVDLRRFVPGHAPLVRPDWLLPEPDRDFLRTFGAIRRRPLGALQGWVGEGIVCRANRALTFPEGLVATTFNKQIWRVWGVNKTFFHDGLGAAKLEVSYKVVRNKGKAANVNNVVEEMLNRPVAIPGHADARPRVLGDVGQLIAAKFRDASSTNENRNAGEGSNLVRAGRPCVLIQHSSRRGGNIPPFAREFILPLQYEDTAWGLKPGRASAIRVFYWQVKFQGSLLPVFYCQHDGATAQNARNLRIYLSRMWTEIESLAGCLRAIRDGTLKPTPRGDAAQELQRYLNRAMKNIKRLGTNSTKIVGHDIYDIGYSVFEAFNGADITRLEQALQTMEIRPNVVRSLRDLSRGAVPTTVIIEPGGKYIVKQDIKFGDGSQFNQVQSGASVGEILGPDNRVQTSIVNNQLSALSADLENLVLEAVKSGAIANDGHEIKTVKELVDETKKAKPDSTKVLGALGTIETALSHISGIGEKIHAITDLIRGVL